MSERDRFGILFELIEDAVADVEIVDGRPIVRAVNPAFVADFGYEREEIVGESLNEFIVPGPFSEQATNFDQRTKCGQVNRAVVSRQTARGIRHFRYRGIPYERDGASYGLAIYTDVTDEHLREQHHQVLYRVLRHELEANLSPMVPGAERVAREAPDAITDAAEAVHDAAAALAAVQETAADVERILGQRYIERTERDLSAVLEDALGTVAASYPDARIERDLPASLPVTADDRLTVALETLLEHALERDEAAPVVSVTAREEPTGAVVTITGDDAGRSATEREPAFEDSTARLDDERGLDLWLATWIVEEYGGRLGYSREDGAATVRVVLPVADGE